jgi:serine/threonine protein kinase
MHQERHSPAVILSIMAQPTHQSALPLGSMLMEYRLASVLGAGGFGITYLARDTNLEKDVAIKEYLPGSVAVRAADQSVCPTSLAHQDDYRWGLDRFIQESRTLAKFGHANIVRVNRFFEANGTGYMVMATKRASR